MKVLCIDGPIKGDIWDLPEDRERTFLVPVMPVVTRPTAVLAWHTYTYHVHRFLIGDATLMLASVHSLPDLIGNAGLLSMILSEDAQQVIR